MEHKNTFKKGKWVDTMIRKKVNIVFLQETKWVGVKSREIENIWYRLGKENYINGIGITVHKKLKDNVVHIKIQVIE